MAPVWVFDGPNEYIFPSSEWNEWKKFWITVTNLKKMPILAILGHFMPIFGPVQIWYGRQILGDSVLTSDPARVKWKTPWSDNQKLKIAKKGVFTSKIAKKWIFERDAQEILKNEGQIRVWHEKICQNSEVPELKWKFYTYISISSLTTSKFA